MAMVSRAVAISISLVSGSSRDRRGPSRFVLVVGRHRFFIAGELHADWPDLVLPEILEPIRSHFGISHRVHDIFVAHI
jgi:hypothetical protein